MVAAALAAAGLTGAAQAEAAATPIYFVHGYNDTEKSNCASLWGKALDYFQAQARIVTR
jgi:hypothetical protein